ncbi:hypothetical protein AAFF_G00304790 [Aldrovandia affinis]|uniref:Uncharacterized protein n=1 Tax=Aldrovandia affinis TaxID=143900 RepID=A0AAD7SQ53_9TELE|nr:hypothetical protein AAFF_G00304790 [Aldrovandia affinis]
MFKQRESGAALRQARSLASPSSTSPLSVTSYPERPTLMSSALLSILAGLTLSEASPLYSLASKPHTGSHVTFPSMQLLWRCKALILSIFQESA